MKRVRVVVTGRVQGVCFRAYTRDMADRLGVSGMVRNLSDGTVEIIAEGEDPAVEALVDWASRGPSYARVENVFAETLVYRGDLEGFRISR